MPVKTRIRDSAASHGDGWSLARFEVRRRAVTVVALYVDSASPGAVEAARPEAHLCLRNAPGGSVRHASPGVSWPVGRLRQ